MYKRQGYNTKKVRKTVEIPAGIDNGQCVRIREYGEPGINGGPVSYTHLDVYKRQAVLACSRECNEAGELIYKKHKYDRVTVAAAKYPD